MTAQPHETDTVVQRYAQRVQALGAQLRSGDGYDEWLDPRGVAGRDDLLDLVDGVGVGGLLARRAATKRFVRDDGLTYGSSVDGSPRPWQLDPLPVVLSHQEWADLEQGLAQRAVLLDSLLSDIYGGRRMIAEGALPAATVLGHNGFLPAVDGITLPGKRQLVMTSVDLARSSDGQWTVLADRDQAPSGAGYAMADRRIIARTLSRLYRTTSLARLRGFFDQLGDALLDAAPAGTDQPHIVLLSPGPDSETAFDQAFLASLLGVPLVLGEDLTVRDGKVWRRTTHRPQQVDVILRRVDAAWSDPLDLRGDSRLGVTGLTNAARQGTVSVVNPLGSGVLENPALVPYLPELCKRLLGEELRLADARTWWFGDARTSGEALDRLGELVIKPIGRGTGEPETNAWELSSTELADVRAQILAQPWKWTAQEQVTMSTAPVVGSDGLEPRRLVLRAFGAGGDDGYRFLPGGFGRVSPTGDTWDVSNQNGGVAKDVWVLSPSDSGPRSSGRTRQRDALTLTPHETSALALAPRVADDLFWLGRYCERAETAARLVIVVDDLVADHHGRAGSPGQVAMQEMLHATAQVTGVAQSMVDDQAHPFEYLRRVVFDATTPGTLAYAVSRVVRSAHSLRELLSPDTWLILARIEAAISTPADEDEPLSEVLGAVLEGLIGLSGLAGENTVRDEVWSFMDLGRRMERSLQLSALLRVSVGVERSPVADGQITEAILRACDSVITFRRRLAAGQGPAAPLAGMLELLLRDPINPRSLDFQLGRMRFIATQFEDQQIAAEVDRLAERVLAGVPSALATDRTALVGLTADVTEQVRNLSDLITATYFVRPTPLQRLSTIHDVGVRQ